MNASQQAAEVLLRRRRIRQSLTEWARCCGFEPARHHKLLIEKLELAARGALSRIALFLPPGSAKSTYGNVLFAPWFLAQRQGSSILSCSYSTEKAEEFGRRSRNLIEEHSTNLGFSLDAASKAAGRWETTNGGRFYCTGIGSGIAGYRADLALIDDPIGKKEDADSQLIRDKQWDWYNYDLKPRLKPNATIVLIQTRWHEDDLAGRILANEGEDWTVIRVPLLAEDNDPLGRQPGEPLWPEWFNGKMIEDAQKNPAFVALYQGRPSPEEGDYFKRDWMVEYTPDMLKEQELRFYVGSDHAVGLKQENDFTCMVPVGVDPNDNIWVMPDIFWARADSGVVVDEMLAIAERRRPVCWYAEKGHISAAIGPFLNKRMMERATYFALEELTSSKDKPTRAQSIRGRMQQRKVFFPAWAPWWQRAKHEMLSFPVGTHDDFVDALSEIGRGLDSLHRGRAPVQIVEPDWSAGSQFAPTIKHIKALDALARKPSTRYEDR